MSTSNPMMIPSLGRKHSVLGVVGFSADIPCEATPLSPTDEPYLILWYKDIFGTPIYR